MDKINKLSLPATIIIASIILGGFYYVSQVSKQNSIERQQQIEIEQKNAQIDAEKFVEQRKEENLSICLSESEYGRSTAHLALCGDPNVGLSPTSCYRVFGGTKSYLGVLNNYEAEFPNSLPKIPEDLSGEEFTKAIVEIPEQNSKIIGEYWDKCNCGLPKYARDGLDKEREKRDEICTEKYGK